MNEDRLKAKFKAWCILMLIPLTVLCCVSWMVYLNIHVARLEATAIYMEAVALSQAEDLKTHDKYFEKLLNKECRHDR